MNVTRLASPCSSVCVARKRVAVSGHTSGQVVYRNVSATTCPRCAESVTARPLTPSVSVKSGASLAPRSVPASVGGAHAPSTRAATQMYRTTRLIEPTIFAIALRQPFPRGRRTMAIAMIVGLINIGWSWAIIFWSEQFVPSGLVSVFGAAAPVWTAVLAHFIVKDDRLSALKILGLALGLVGTVILIGAPEAAEGTAGLIATGLLALMPITWAIAAILQSRFLRTVAPIPTVALGTWASALLLAPLALLQTPQGQHWTLASVLAF